MGTNKSLFLVCNSQICFSFLPDIFPSQVFFVFSWLPPCFQKFIWQIHERIYFLHIIKMNNCMPDNKKRTPSIGISTKREVSLYTPYSINSVKTWNLVHFFTTANIKLLKPGKALVIPFSITSRPFLDSSLSNVLNDTILQDVPATIIFPDS